MPHMIGQYRYPPVLDGHPEHTFLVHISWSKDASITNDIFVEFIENFLVPKYTDAEDIPGKRVIIKADSGPGQFNVNFRTITQSNGFYFFPDLPNGTEIGQ